MPRHCALILTARCVTNATAGFVLEWPEYLKLFKHVKDELAVGEASVSYLPSMDAAQAIRARIPGARIIMMLRDPAQRLFSHYTAARIAGATDATFSRVARRSGDG